MLVWQLYLSPVTLFAAAFVDLIETIMSLSVLLYRSIIELPCFNTDTQHLRIPRAQRVSI